MCSKAGTLADAPRFGEELRCLAFQVVGAANIGFGGQPEDRLQLIAAQFVDHHLVRADDHLGDLRPTRGLDDHVFARFEAHASGMEVEDLASVAKAHASDGRLRITHGMR